MNKWNVSSLEALAERGESLQRSINDNEQPAYIIDSLKNELEYVKSDLQTANELWSQYTESTNELTMLQS